MKTPHYVLFALGAVLGVLVGLAPTTSPYVMDALWAKGSPTFPASFSSVWSTAIGAGGVTTLDAATITNPLTEIGADKLVLSREKHKGTTVQWRLRYNPTGLTVSAPLRVAVFGYTITTEGPQRWTNRNGDNYMMFTPNTTTDERFTDSSGTVWAYTAVDPLMHLTDCMACDFFVAGVEQAAAASAGSFATARLEAKMQ